MCLAIPGKVIEILKDNKAKLDFGGIVQEVALDMLSDVEEGDFLMVHAGFAIEKVDLKQADETLALVKELGEFSHS
ncbi:MAG: HypC/HybG/HupF family hydrogenase formation chaperone [Enterococcus sp.]|nr:HypC/HybG/HupF family hydrogenase formation chaperone [Enterococcus sp.]